MWRRILLALVFVGALGAASVGFTNTAEAGHGCYRGGHGHGHGRGYYSAYYGPSYGPSPYYGPRVRRSYYYGPPAYYGPNYGYYSQPYYGGSGVSFSVGF